MIKGKVKAVVKGGLTVNIGVEAFLPGSQIDIVPPKDLQQFVGNTYDFKIVKINDERKNVVLSRREIIEQERAEKRTKFLESVKVGDTVIQDMPMCRIGTACGAGDSTDGPPSPPPPARSIRS